mmetsp:Transcript_49652/g.130608  ORF Transcript_49652/g.130608 Transcript_49652/m.130608 type:complete len:203 (+) Transcript_49652:99-707(+)
METEQPVNCQAPRASSRAFSSAPWSGEEKVPLSAVGKPSLQRLGPTPSMRGEHPSAGAARPPPEIRKVVAGGCTVTRILTFICSQRIYPRGLEHSVRSADSAGDTRGFPNEGGERVAMILAVRLNELRWFRYTTIGSVGSGDDSKEEERRLCDPNSAESAPSMPSTLNSRRAMLICFPLKLRIRRLYLASRSASMSKSFRVS